MQCIIWYTKNRCRRIKERNMVNNTIWKKIRKIGQGRGDRLTKIKFRIILKDDSHSPYLIECATKKYFLFWSPWGRYPGSDWHRNLEDATNTLKRIAANELQRQKIKQSKPRIGTVFVEVKNYSEADLIVDKLSGKVN